MRLLIADDHELLRDTLGSFLDREDEFAIQTVGCVDDALARISASPPFDLVLLDYGMPGMDALRGLQTLLDLPDAPPVVLMSGFASRDVVTQALQMGARGFLHKSMPASSLLNAIRFLALGERYVPVDVLLASPSILAPQPSAVPMLAPIAGPAPDAGPAGLPQGRRLSDLLTTREAEVLRALCRGAPNKEIARDLGLSLPTIKLHVKTLYRRLGVSNRTQAAMAAQIHGFR
ncbi:MAG: response regulator [Roseinatronobacter sp.]